MGLYFCPYTFKGQGENFPLNCMSDIAPYTYT